MLSLFLLFFLQPSLHPLISLPSLGFGPAAVWHALLHFCERLSVFRQTGLLHQDELQYQYGKCDIAVSLKRDGTQDELAILQM